MNESRIESPAIESNRTEKKKRNEFAEYVAISFHKYPISINTVNYSAW